METLGGSLTLSAVSSLVDLNGNDRHETKFRADGVENVKTLAPNLGKSERERPDGRGEGRGERGELDRSTGPLAWERSQPFTHTKWRANSPFLSAEPRGLLKETHICTFTALVLFREAVMLLLPVCYSA